MPNLTQPSLLADIVFYSSSQVEEIYPVHTASFPQEAADYLTLDAFVELTKSQGSILIGAQADGHCLGYVLMRWLGDETEVLSLAVNPPVRNFGLGRQLLNAGIATARGKKTKKIILEVSALNRAAIALYQSCDFKICGLRKGYYRNKSGSVVDALTMILDLVG